MKRMYLMIITMLSVNLIYNDNLLASDKLLQSTDLQYVGAFKVPWASMGCQKYSDLSYGGQEIEYNNNSLYIVSLLTNCVGEISIPSTLGLPGTAISRLPTAALVQNFTDITEGNSHSILPEGGNYAGTVWYGGLLKYGNNLIGSIFAYYDGGNVASLSHFKTGLDLSTNGDFRGMYQMGTRPSPVPAVRFVAGPMTTIPDNSGSGGTNWQADLGGPAITFQGTTGIVSGTSWGPAAFSFDPDDLGVETPVPVQELLYYSQTHPTLGQAEFPIADATNYYFNEATRVKGVVFPEGTKSVLYTGIHGVGTYCYGTATFDTNTLAIQDPSYCYGRGAKGPTTYPKNYQVWAYNAEDLAAVKAGTYEPWEIEPYAIWRLPLPYPDVAVGVDGGASTYDPIHNKLYVVQTDAMAFGDDPAPIIHVFSVNTDTASPAGFTVGGTVSGIVAPIYLQNNAGDYIRISENGPFEFVTALASSSAYNVTQKASYDTMNLSEQLTQKCSISNGAGIISGSNINNVSVVCAPDTGVWAVPLILKIKMSP